MPFLPLHLHWFNRYHTDMWREYPNETKKTLIKPCFFCWRNLRSQETLAKIWREMAACCFSPSSFPTIYIVRLESLVLDRVGCRIWIRTTSVSIWTPSKNIGKTKQNQKFIQRWKELDSFVAVLWWWIPKGVGVQNKKMNPPPSRYMPNSHIYGQDYVVEG